MDMNKPRALIILLLCVVSFSLFSMDIYVNDILWKSYTPTDLESIKLELTDESEHDFGIPLPLLFPLFKSTDGIVISIPSGNIVLQLMDNDFQQGRVLLDPDSGEWNLSLQGSLYNAPYKMEIRAVRSVQNTVTILAEPGLASFKEQIRIWCSLHRVQMNYQESERIRDELIHRKLTGEILPDFILVRQSAAEAYSQEKTVAFSLQSSRSRSDIPGGIMVLPSGNKLHPDLYMSILASRSERVSPHDPGFLTDDYNIKAVSREYFELIKKHSILEQDDFFTNNNYRNKDIAFFPARSFSEQGGSLQSLMIGDKILSPRVFPILLETVNEELPPRGLPDFLKLPGIQYKLFSPEKRQIPEDISTIERRKDSLSPEEIQVYNEWIQGYILSARNYQFRKTIEMGLPDFYRLNGNNQP